MIFFLQHFYKINVLFFIGHFDYPLKMTEILLHIGVHVDESVIINNHLSTTQSMPEMCENLNLNVSILYEQKLCLMFFIDIKIK